MSSETSNLKEPRARVLRGNETSPVPLRISGIKGDYNRNSLSITVGRAGDVQIEITDPVKGSNTIDFMPTLRNGRNPELASKFALLAKELAGLIESGRLR